MGDEGQSRQQERTGSQPPRATDMPPGKHTQRSRPGRRSSYYISPVALTPNSQQGTWSAKLERPLPGLQLGPLVNGDQQKALRLGPPQGKGGQPRRCQFDPMWKGKLSQGREPLLICGLWPPFLPACRIGRIGRRDRWAPRQAYL